MNFSYTGYLHDLNICFWVENASSKFFCMMRPKFVMCGAGGFEKQIIVAKIPKESQLNLKSRKFRLFILGAEGPKDL